MALRVVGAGVGRTGTNSLKLAFEHLLGEPCYHMFEVRNHPEHIPMWDAAARDQAVDWDAMMDGYAAAVDWPASGFWPELSRHYPESIVVLSRRDPEAWWKSASETIFPRILTAVESDRHEWHQMVMAILSRHFTTDLGNHDACIAAFLKHEEEVRQTIPKERLVVWEPGDGWEPLCTALDLPVPNIDFPKVNSTDEFKAMIAASEAAKAEATS